MSSQSRNDRGLFALVRPFLLVLCLLIHGCATTKIVTDSLVVGCGTGTVYLKGWYSGVPDSQVMFDPIGGYEFYYWIDEGNNVCHGNPGTNGQPGVAVIKAFKLKADEAARNNSTVSADQLKDFQEIPVSLDHYSGSGLHFVQFLGTLARTRSDGKAMKFPGLTATISTPDVIEVGKKSCTVPVALRLNDPPLPLPSFNGPDPNSQDPGKCKVRTMPHEATMTEEDRKKYDSGLFAHGTEIYEVP